MINPKAAKDDLARRMFSHGFRCLGRVYFFVFCRVQIIYLAGLPQERAMILASNHISHFDPLLLGTFFARYVDWMAMEELFVPLLARSILDWLCAFPVTRNGRDRRAMRIALRRLQSRRTVGVFPEGGIRAGSSSVLEGAPMWAALSVLSNKPIVPCVIFGSAGFIAGKIGCRSEGFRSGSRSADPSIQQAEVQKTGRGRQSVSPLRKRFLT